MATGQYLVVSSKCGRHVDDNVKMCSWSLVDNSAKLTIGNFFPLLSLSVLFLNLFVLGGKNARQSTANQNLDSGRFLFLFHGFKLQNVTVWQMFCGVDLFANF